MGPYDGVGVDREDISRMWVDRGPGGRPHPMKDFHHEFSVESSLSWPFRPSWPWRQDVPVMTRSGPLPNPIGPASTTGIICTSPQPRRFHISFGRANWSWLDDLGLHRQRKRRVGHCRCLRSRGRPGARTGRVYPYTDSGGDRGGLRLPGMRCLKMFDRGGRLESGEPHCRRLPHPPRFRHRRRRGRPHGLRGGQGLGHPGVGRVRSCRAGFRPDRFDRIAESCRGGRGANPGHEFITCP